MSPPFSGVVAIDGPSGSGKSTVARLLAHRLGARYLDTGAMYRAVAWAVLQAGVSPDDPGAVATVARRCQLRVGTDPQSPHVSVDGVEIDAQIRAADVTGAVSAVAAVPAVRALLVAAQRELIGGAGPGAGGTTAGGITAGGIVVEGRDIGTVVVPEATVKVFLTADSRVRAGRRGAELGTPATDQVAADLLRRDALDSTRALSPLAKAADAVVLDTSELAIDDVVERLIQLVSERAGDHGAAT